MHSLVRSAVKLECLSDTFLQTYDKIAPLFLYGAGNSVYFAMDFTRKHGVNVLGIIDSNAEKQGCLLCGLPVLSPDDAFVRFPQLSVLISAPSYAAEIQQTLVKRMPVERIYYFEYERAYYCEPKDYQSYLSSHESEIDALCSILADERSRETLEGILKLWCSANPKYLRGIYTPDQYFPNDVLRLTSKESFVDCGAYTGDTYVQFKEAVKGEYHRYFGFEPHTESCAILQATVGVNERNICFGIGLSDKHETLRFLEANEVGTASAINNGQVVIKTVTLDEIISDEVTFIKMDIEGSELAALRGSEQTIRKNKPKLAICVYHKAEDLVEIPRFIMSLGLDYRFYLRHHQRHSGTETVFYAI